MNLEIILILALYFFCHSSIAPWLFDNKSKVHSKYYGHSSNDIRNRLLSKFVKTIFIYQHKFRFCSFHIFRRTYIYDMATSERLKDKRNRIK